MVHPPDDHALNILVLKFREKLRPALLLVNILPMISVMQLKGVTQRRLISALKLAAK